MPSTMSPFGRVPTADGSHRMPFGLFDIACGEDAHARHVSEFGVLYEGYGGAVDVQVVDRARGNSVLGRPTAVGYDVDTASMTITTTRLDWALDLAASLMVN